MQTESEVPIGRIHIDPERLPVRRALCPRTLDRLVQQFRRDPASVPPILVWPDPDQPDRLFVVSGCHRVEAARIAGATHISVVVLRRSEAEAATLALLKLIRPGRPGSAWDTAQAMRVLWERLDQPSGRMLAERLGKGRTQVASYLRVATELPDADVREALHHAEMDSGVLRQMPLGSLYKIACSHELLADRLERLTDEIRTRQAPKDSTSDESEAIPTNAGSPDPGHWGLAGFSMALALAGAVGFLLARTPVRCVHPVRCVRIPDAAPRRGRP